MGLFVIVFRREFSTRSWTGSHPGGRVSNNDRFSTRASPLPARNGPKPSGGGCVPRHRRWALGVYQRSYARPRGSTRWITIVRVATSSSTITRQSPTRNRDSARPVSWRREAPRGSLARRSIAVNTRCLTCGSSRSRSLSARRSNSTDHGSDVRDIRACASSPRTRSSARQRRGRLSPRRAPVPQQL